MKKTKTLAIAAAFSAALVSAGWAQQGPVATACVDDIAKHCADKEHGHGEVRACLQAHKDKVSAACKIALETTGGGR
jgi:Cysteine rich repeat